MNQVYFSRSDISNETLNSVVVARMVKFLNLEEYQNEMCKKHPCLASVEILNIVKNGQNYHGQFSKGDTLKVYFEFTLDNTNKIFPELNKCLPGLKKNETFQAELFENPDKEDDYRIQLYALMN